MKKIIPIILLIRGIGELGLLYFAYTETGIHTAIVLLFIIIAIELLVMDTM